MTFEQKLQELCISNGMFPAQAKAVVDAVKENNKNLGMDGRWNEDISGYPPMMLTVLWVTTKREAVAWIDANLPLAWYRPVFAE